MRRLIALGAVFCVGLLAALALTARPASAGIDCTTDTAAAVASATVTDRGLAWSSPANPDPTWTVDMPSIGASIDLQAPDDAGARAKAKAWLDGQLASLGCGTTTTTQAATTATPTTTTTPDPPTTATTTVVSTATETTTRTVTTSTPPVIVVLPTPAQTVTEAHTTTEAVTVTTPAPVPRRATVTVQAKPVPCPRPAATKKPKGAH